MTNEFAKLHALEWLETNGLGGYASGTLSGANSRRYHGLLVAAMHPPVGRMVVVSKLEETLIVGNHRFELSANQYPGAIHPQGFQYLTSFERNEFPEFIYKAGDVELKKTIACIHGENTTLVLYEIVEASGSFEMELLPFYACRDFHSLAHANESIGQHYLFEDGVFRTLNYKGCPEMFISVPHSKYIENKNWYFNFEYSVEQYRGLDFKEDLYTHGKFSVILKKGSKLGVILSIENTNGRDAFKLFNAEKKRRKEITDIFRRNDKLKQLALAADQFIVKRGELNTIIAGYHWFSDWGRDTMISLPGLCLTTGRHDVAKKILSAFAKSVSKGMLPNRFPDYGEEPEYNTIDATLWFFQAIYKYYEHTGDKLFVKSLLPILKEIIEWHYNGTRYNIHVDVNDELLAGGEEGVQLTWMDARVGDWVVTPRRGKPVEINALWYNALSIMGLLLVETGDVEESEVYRMKACRVLESFNNLFWNEEQECLYDYIDGDYRNDDIRPNQIFAISLPFPLLMKGRAEKVFDTVTQKLLTAKGLRSLPQNHRDYVARYGGGVWSRDGSYHQGTVWSFLMGPYIDALMTIKGEQAKPQAVNILHKFLEQLNEGCVGSVSEIFDADPPHDPRGCIAQAWGVGEVLRVAIEHDLLVVPKTKKKSPSRVQ